MTFFGVLEGIGIWGRNEIEQMRGNDLLTSTWMRSLRLGCDMARQKGGGRGIRRRKGRKERGKLFFFAMKRESGGGGGSEMKLSILTKKRNPRERIPGRTLA